MTDPNDDLDSVADPGGVPDGESGGDLNYDEAHYDDVNGAEREPGVPGQAVDSPAAQGSPVGPPD